MMPPIGVPELLVILALILLVFGPKKLPEIARGLGQGIRELRYALREAFSQDKTGGPPGSGVSSPAAGQPAPDSDPSNGDRASEHPSSPLCSSKELPTPALWPPDGSHPLRSGPPEEREEMPMEQEVVVELFWYRFGSGEWVASVTDDATGATYEVRRVSELEAVLRKILIGRGRRTLDRPGQPGEQVPRIEDAATGD